MNLPWEKMSWARRELPDEKVDRSPSEAADIFSRGDVIYTVGNSADNRCNSCRFRRRKARWSRWIRRTAR